MKKVLIVCESQPEGRAACFLSAVTTPPVKSSLCTSRVSHRNHRVTETVRIHLFIYSPVFFFLLISLYPQCITIREITHPRDPCEALSLQQRWGVGYRGLMSSRLSHFSPPDSPFSLHFQTCSATEAGSTDTTYRDVHILIPASETPQVLWRIPGQAISLALRDQHQFDLNVLEVAKRQIFLCRLMFCSKWNKQAKRKRSTTSVMMLSHIFTFLRACLTVSYRFKPHLAQLCNC